MGELHVEQMFSTYRDVESLNKVLAKVSMDGLEDNVIADVLIAVALTSEANASLEAKIKAINEKMPQPLKDYNKDAEKDHSEKELAIINRYYAQWQENYSIARDALLDVNSNIELKDIKVLTKDQIVSWAKANKKDIKVTDSAILYKLMLKKA